MPSTSSASPTLPREVFLPVQAASFEPDDSPYDAVDHLLFVPDEFENRILVFDVANDSVPNALNGENAVAVIGQPDFTSNAPAVTQAGLYSDHCADYDRANNTLYVSDYGNSRILEFPMIDITTSCLPAGTVNIPYSATVTTANA